MQCSACVFVSLSGLTIVCFIDTIKQFEAVER